MSVQNTSPGSVSPASSPAEPSLDEEVHPVQVPVETYTAAYTKLYSPILNQGVGGTSYQRVTNPLSLEQQEETDTKINGNTKPHVTFAPPPLSDAIAVNGEHYRE